MHMALHVHDEQVQGGFAVADVALADQDFCRVVVNLAVIDEVSTDQAAEAASDDRVFDAVSACDCFDGCDDVFVRLDASDEALTAWWSRKVGTG